MAIGTTAAIVGGSLIGAGASLYGSSKAAGAAKDASAATVAENQRQFDTVREDTAELRGLGSSAIGRINRLYGYGGQSKPLSYEDWLKQNPPSYGGYSQYANFPGGLPMGPMLADASSRQRYEAYARDYQPTAPSGPDMSVFFESPDYQFNLSEQEKAINRASAARGRYDSGAVRTQLSRNASGMASREFSSFYDRLAQQAGLGVTGIGASANAGAQAAGNIGAAYLNAGQQRGSAYAMGAQGVNSAIQGGIQNYYLDKYLNAGEPA